MNHQKLSSSPDISARSQTTLAADFNDISPWEDTISTVIGTDAYFDADLNPPSPRLPTWKYKLAVDTTTDAIVSMLAYSPDNHLQARLNRGDTFHRVTAVNTVDGTLIRESRLFKLEGFERDDDDVLWLNLIDYAALTNTPTGKPDYRRDSRPVDRYRIRCSAAKFTQSLIAVEGDWQRQPADFHNPKTEAPMSAATQSHIDLTAGTPYGPLEHVSDLEVEEPSGEGTRAMLNTFLTGGPDGRVSHRLGPIIKYKRAFVARGPSDAIVSVLVLAPHPNASLQDDVAYISRIASHPIRPPNTSSWLIAKARSWARTHGYDAVCANAGIGDNTGIAYLAAGFELDTANTGWVSGDARTREGRDSYREDALWYRRRWIYRWTTDDDSATTVDAWTNS